MLESTASLAFCALELKGVGELTPEKTAPCSGFEITRGYAGFWVFEALLNEVRVWVFVGMGIRKKKCQSVRTMNTFILQVHPYLHA